MAAGTNFGAQIQFSGSGTQTVSGAGQIGDFFMNAGNVVLAKETTFRGAFAGARNGPAITNLVNHGTMIGEGSVVEFGVLNPNSTFVSDGTLTGSFSIAGRWSNQNGTLSIHNGSVTLGGSFKWSDLGTRDFVSPSITINGTLDNTATTMDVNATTQSITLKDAGTINGGTVRTRDGAELLVARTANQTSNYPALSNVTLDGTVRANSGLSSMYLNGTTTLTSGSQIILGANGIRGGDLITGS